MLESTREIGGKPERETRLYISSIDLPVAQLSPVIRAHWAVENSLYQVPVLKDHLTEILRSLIRRELHPG